MASKCQLLHKQYHIQSNYKISSELRKIYIEETKDYENRKTTHKQYPLPIVNTYVAHPFEIYRKTHVS